MSEPIFSSAEEARDCKSKLKKAQGTIEVVRLKNGRLSEELAELRKSNKMLLDQIRDEADIIKFLESIIKTFQTVIERMNNEH